MALTSDDKIEIYDLIARYNRAIDSGAVHDWVATFTPDGEFHGIVGHFRGHDELLRFAEDYWSKPEYEQFRQAQHWVNNIIVDGEGDHATLFCHHMMVGPMPGGAQIILLASYNDRLRKFDGSWRFERRHVTATPMPDAPGDAAGPGSSV